MSSQPKVVINRKAIARLDTGHIWIYKSDVLKAVGVQAGDAVHVVDERGWTVGTALFSAASQITLRFLSRQEHDAEKLLTERLKLAVELRARVFAPTTGHRLVHGEGDLLPGLVVDRYGDALSVQILTAAMEKRRDSIIDQLMALTGAKIVVERSDVPARRHEGLEQRKAVVRGELTGPVEYREGDVTLVVDLMEGQKTGAFLDQRDNHVLAGELSFGRALDCFSYQGGFALQLARKATEVVAVDSSEKAVAEIAVNATRNGRTNITTVMANAFDYLREKADAREKFDTIVLDPPAFTKSKDSIDAAIRGYKEINLRAISMLKPGGLLVTASCSYHLDEARFEEMIMAAAKDSGRSLQLLERRGAGHDHPVLMGVPETRYLKCFFARAF